MKIKMIHLKLKIIAGVFALTAAMCLFSGCSGSENIKENDGVGMVTLELEGIHDIGEGGVLRAGSLSETVFLPKNESRGIMSWCTMASAPVSSTRATSVPMDSGIKYYVVFRNTSTNALEGVTLATTGGGAFSVYLPNGTYDLIAYSFNNDGTGLPAPSSSIAAPAGTDLLYYKSATPMTVSANNEYNMNITFSHKFSRIISYSIDASKLTLKYTDRGNSKGRDIQSFGDAQLICYNAVLDLATGSLSKGAQSNLTVGGWNGVPGTQLSCTDGKWLYTGGDGLSVNFPYIRFDYASNNEHNNFGMNFTKVPEAGYRYTLSVKLLGGCGAYHGSGVWRDWYCWNTGADTSADPFVLNSSTNGSYYKWDNPTAVASATTGSGAISGWSNSSSTNSIWLGVNNPCPTGYRVPTKAEFDELLANNTSRAQTGATWGANANRYSNGRWLGDYLLLPAAGDRLNHKNGQLAHRGEAGYYWSSTGTSTSSQAYYLYLDKNGQGVYGGTDGKKAHGFSVRCIAE